MLYILTRREIEFIEDWLKVQQGEMSLEEFFEKWGSKKDSTKVLEDFEKVKAGEMTLEDFRRKWRRKGDWKCYVRVMRHRLDKKRKKNLRKILNEIKEEIRLLEEFFLLRTLALKTISI